MKTIPLLLILAAWMFFTQAAYSDTTAQEALTEAQIDYNKGDLEAAKERFEFVLQLDPHNLTATNYLRMIETELAKSGKSGAALEKSLAALVVPHVALKSATFDATLDYLKTTAEKLSNGKVKANFVVAIPEDAAAKTRVSLDLTSVPFTEVLHYISEQTGFTFKIEKYAITVKMPSAEPAAVTTGSDTAPPPDTGAPK